MVAARRALPVLVLWAALAAPLSVLATRVRDWFDMTDELRYERLAISIARTHSLVPRIHDVNIESLSQLYPLLIAPVFGHACVPHALFAAHLLNAIVMSSACIPSFLLAAALFLSATGRLSRIVGIYGVYTKNASFLSSAFFGSLVEHAATFALALAILPAVIAGGWLLANVVRPAPARELHAFACLGSIAIAAFVVQATDFDVRYTGFVHDR